MPWVLLLTITFLLAAIVIIELRAVGEGDELNHHAPGYVPVIGGLVLIGLGIAAAVSNQTEIALALSSAGLIAVAFGTTRRHEAAGR